jgi:DNA repair exonuclease SbcCD ATPase subunit
MGSEMKELAAAIGAQTEETRKNTAAFERINAKLGDQSEKLDGVKESLEKVHGALTNGGFAHLEKRFCAEITESEERFKETTKMLVEEAGKAAAASLVTALNGTMGKASLQLPKAGWAAVILFLLLMLVAVGVRIQDLLNILKAAG